MVATSTGLYRQEGNKFVPFSTDADELLKKAAVYVCAPLSNGDLSIGTIQGGLVLLTPAGHVDKIIDKQSGLASSYVNAIYNDRAGSVWLALNLGIVHIETELPVTRFGDAEGIGETVPAIYRHRGTLYAGTVSGLSKLIPGPDAHFEQVSGIKGGVLSMLSTPDGLLIAGQYGVWNLGPNGLELIFPNEAMLWLAQSMHDPHLYYAAGRHGLLLLRFDAGRWRRVRQVPSENQDFLSVIEDLDGRIWATTPKSILRINLSSDPAQIQRFALEGGAVTGWNYAYRVNGRVVFATGKGLRRFDEESGRLAPDTRFGTMFADGSRDVIRIAETPA
jgi:ligand-binding sensor domain-containing protein